MSVLDIWPKSLVFNLPGLRDVGALSAQKDSDIELDPVDLRVLVPHARLSSTGTAAGNSNRGYIGKVRCLSLLGADYYIGQPAYGGTLGLAEPRHGE